MGYPLKQSQTARPLLFKLYLAGTLDPATGKTPTVTLSKNGAAFASPAGAVTEVASGVYKVAGNATDTATLGPLWLHAEEAASDDCDDVFEVVAFDPDAALATPTNITAGTIATVTNRVTANTDQLAGQTVTAAAGVTFPASVGTSTLTQAQVSGGSYALNSPSFAFNASMDFTTAQKAATLAHVTLTDTVTTYTGNTPQTGDSFTRIGALGAGLTSLAPAATALTSATWTDARAGYLSNLSSGAVPTLAQILAGGDVDGYTLEQTLKLCLAALAGKLSGASTTTITIRAADDSKARVTATCDSDGNRTSLTLDATG